MIDLLESVSLVHEALAPLDPAQRSRVLASVTALLGDDPAPRKPIPVPVQRAKVKAEKPSPKAKRSPAHDTTDLESQIEKILGKHPDGMKPREIGAIIKMDPQKYDFKLATRRLVETNRARAQGNTSTRIYFPSGA